MENTHINCRHCRSLVLMTDPFCPQCGAPNEPEPKPWYTSMGHRVKAAFGAKTESVWADRLASLMPLQFIFSGVTLYLSLNPPTTIVTTISIVAMASVLIYYPGWYKNLPEKRKGYGLVHFLISLVQLVIVYKTLMG